MNPRYDITDLEDYLNPHSDMSPSDRAEMEAALATDPELALRLDALRAEPQVMVLLQKELLRQRLSAWKTGQKKRRLFFGTALVIGLLVAVAIIAAFYFWQIHRTPEREVAAPDQIAVTPPPAVIPPRGMVDTTDNTEPLVHPESYSRTQTAYFVQIADDLIAVNKPGRSYTGGSGAGDSLYNRALAQYETDAPEALRLLQRSEQLDSANVNVLRLQAYLLYSLGRNTEAARAYARLKTVPNTLYLVDAEKAEIACYLGLLPGARSAVDSLLDQIILAGEDVHESRKKFARELRAKIEKRYK
jgi:hypothetical protein